MTNFVYLSSRPSIYSYMYNTYILALLYVKYTYIIIYRIISPTEFCRCNIFCSKPWLGFSRDSLCSWWLPSTLWSLQPNASHWKGTKAWTVGFFHLACNTPILLLNLSCVSHTPLTNKYTWKPVSYNKNERIQYTYIILIIYQISIDQLISAKFFTNPTFHITTDPFPKLEQCFTLQI